MRPGDIGAVIEPGIVCRLSARLILPPTEFFHFFLVTEYIPPEKDWVILESIPSHGVTVSRLSMYRQKPVSFFRPNLDAVQAETALTPEEIGQRACWQATKHGRLPYDYRLCLIIGFRTFYGCFKNFFNGRGFNIDFTEIPFSRDKRLLCTEMVDEAYYELYPVFDRRYELLPANFMKQYLEGWLDFIGGWTGKER